MKQLVFAALLAVPVPAIAQDTKWQVTAQIQPELTFYRSSYPGLDAPGKTSVNPGLAAGLQYHVNKRVFLTAGLAYTRRTFDTKAHLFQGGLPEGKRSGSMELVTVRTITYRIVSAPLGAGYYFLRLKKLGSFATAGVAANYLVNASYASNFERYDGTYAKNELLGISASVGAGIDYRLNRHLQVTANLMYAIINPIREDAYLLGRNGLEALTHTSLSLGICAKLRL